MIKYRKQLFLITYALILAFVLIKFEDVRGMIKNFFVLIGPFIYGFAFAYLINIPVTFFVKKLFKVEEGDRTYKKKRGIAIVLSYVLVFAVIILVFATLIPQLANSISVFVGNMNSYSTQFESLSREIMSRVDLQESSWIKVQNFLVQSKEQIIAILQNIVPSVIGIATGAFNGILNTGFTLIISIYILISKDDLAALISNTLQVTISNKARSIYIMY
ncbi:AI-2E family transporter [Cellulosilyticum ruminicola]|uniref:AI-2E family transporter n=1 Tax=Cellulosilyticum ruminicola TaxID=425254 RepID=UPI0006D16F78|nr:AI-2E family transporter [Cellulosilyticum ruminicola]